MKKETRYIEVYKNGQIAVESRLTVTPEGDYKQYQQYVKSWKSCGYKVIETGDNYCVLFEPIKKMSICVSYRIRLDYTDKNGNPIYLDSYLENKNGDRSVISKNPFTDEYYFRIVIKDGLWRDIPITETDWKKYKVVKSLTKKTPKTNI